MKPRWSVQPGFFPELKWIPYKQACPPLKLAAADESFRSRKPYFLCVVSNSQLVVLVTRINYEFHSHSLEFLSANAQSLKNKRGLHGLILLIVKVTESNRHRLALQASHPLAELLGLTHTSWLDRWDSPDGGSLLYEISRRPRRARSARFKQISR